MWILFEDIYLRAVEREDLDKFFEMMCRGDANKYTTPYWLPWSRHDFERYIDSSEPERRSRYAMAICLPGKKNERFIGVIELHKLSWIHGHAEVGVLICDNTDRGKGYGTKSIQAISKWAFDTLRLRRIYAKMFSSNIASRRCFEKAGFVQEGVWRSHYFINGLVEDCLLYGLLSEER